MPISFDGYISDNAKLPNKKDTRVSTIWLDIKGTIQLIKTPPKNPPVAIAI